MRFTVQVRKRDEWTWVWKTIKYSALPYWKEIMESGGSNDYIFSVGLVPGPSMIQPYQITKRWYRLVKKKTGVTADIYSLKHTNSTEVKKILSERDAAAMNSHTSTEMVAKVYDMDREIQKIREEKEQHERLKNVGNTFS